MKACNPEVQVALWRNGGISLTCNINMLIMVMNKFLIAFILLCFPLSAVAQTDSLTVQPRPTAKELYPEGVKVPRFKLYPTENMWIHLKLDTAKGIVWMVQYSVSDKSSRMEYRINLLPLAWGDRAVNGRFELYPTKNMFNFIMVDTIDGSTFQVQWSTDGNDGIIIIKDNSLADEI